MKARDFFELREGFRFKGSFDGELRPWEWVSKVKGVLNEFFAEYDSRELIERLKREHPNLYITGSVYMEEGVELPPYGVIEGPAYIGAGTELRPGVYIRGNVIVGEGCVLGNSCEYKNSLLLDGVESAHFNYVGDSILGNKAHLGAGVILANLRLDRGEVFVKYGGERMGTGMRKLGGMLGDGVEVACNSVVQPGSLIEKGAHIFRS